MAKRTAKEASIGRGRWEATLKNIRVLKREIVDLKRRLRALERSR